MENKQSGADEILKQESIGYLKSAINLQQGSLFMTSKKLTLEAHKTGVGGLGILGAFLKSKVEKVNTIFEIDYANIQAVTQGKHGLQKNVLEIKDRQNNLYRVIVKNYQEWEDAIKQKM
jgi:hypothetical protein